MLRSNDSGGTWSLVNTANFARASVKAIVVSPDNPDLVTAGTARGRAGRDLGPVFSPPVFGVQRSTNGGWGAFVLTPPSSGAAGGRR